MLEVEILLSSVFVIVIFSLLFVVVIEYMCKPTSLEKQSSMIDSFIKFFKEPKI